MGNQSSKTQNEDRSPLIQEIENDKTTETIQKTEIENDKTTETIQKTEIENDKTTETIQKTEIENDKTTEESANEPNKKPTTEDTGVWSFFRSFSQKVDEIKEKTHKGIANTSVFNLETKQSIGELYKLLEEYGQDISLSDLFVGYLILTSHYKFSHPYNQNYVSSKEMEEAAYYMKFANAVYGWKLVEGILHSNFGNVLSGFSKKFSATNDAEIAHNLASYTSYTGLSADTIVCSNWFSCYMEPAHIICISEEKKRIIVSIRGTMDAHDCLSDVICTYQTLETGQCHKGMRRCAENKLAVIEQPLLDALEKYPGYGVCLTGHSLGAGTAGIMIYLLKKKYPNLDLIGRLFGCPPIFDIENARAFSPFITCYVNRDDIIPRLTYGSLYDLKAMIKCVLDDNPNFSQRVWQVVSAGGSLPKFIRDKMDESIVKSGHDIQKLKSLKISEKIFQPGKIIYIYQPKEIHNYSAWYGEVTNNQEFDEIILSSHMFRDHFPWLYEENIKHCVEKHKVIEINTVDGENAADSVELGFIKDETKIEVNEVRLVVGGEEINVEETKIEVMK